MTLSLANIDRIITQAEALRSNLETKAEKVVQALCDEGAQIAKSKIAFSTVSETIESKAERLHGEISAGENAVWLEFGTGVKHNTPEGTSPHPKGEKLGMLIGRYGKGHGASPNGWWYPDGDEFKHTYGVRSRMFMWDTAQELRQILPQIAEREFND